MSIYNRHPTDKMYLQSERVKKKIIYEHRKLPASVPHRSQNTATF
jgi:hypothetical protein